jgi:membrane protein
MATVRHPSAWRFFFKPRVLLGLLKKTATEWLDDNVPRLGAALSYYTVFSIAPLIIIAITIAGLVFNNAHEQVMGEIKGLVGENGSDAINSMMDAAQKPDRSVIATALGFVTLLFGAAGVFIQLKDAMNTVWNVPPAKAGGLWKFVRKYFVSFSMVLGLGFLLLVSLVLSAGLSFLGTYLEQFLPGMGPTMKILSFVVSFGIISCLFAVLFKFLPDTKVSWNDVWVGAVLTSLLFTVGKFLLGFYFAKSDIASAYGTVGSLVLVLLWVYYSAQILFFGAEFTQVFSRHHGSRLTEATVRESMSPKERLIDDIERDRKKLSRDLQKVGLGKTVSKRAKLVFPGRKNL